MTRHMTSRLLLAGLVAALPSGVYGQSLADVAAAAETARRKTAAGPVKTYTNDDLGGTSSTGAAPAAAAPAKSTDAAAKKDEPKAPVDEKKTEKYWKDRASSLEGSLARNKILLDALQSQVNGLNAEYLTKDDPGQRALLEKKIQTASTRCSACSKRLSSRSRSQLSSRPKPGRPECRPDGFADKTAARNPLEPRSFFYTLNLPDRKQS